MIDRKLKGEALIGKKCKPVGSLINHAGEGITDKTICTIISVVRGHGFTIRTQKCAYCGQFCEMSHVSREQIELVSKTHVADVVQVVRCKDCVCMGKRPPLPEGYREDCGWCMLHGRVVLPEDFCSNGERMDDDESP